MAVKETEKKYVCSVCGTRYVREFEAETCKKNHDLLLVPMTKTELNRLINALFLGQPELVPESLYETLRKMQSENFR